MSHGSRNKSFEDEPAVFSNQKSRLFLRAQIVQAIREFFISHGYLEVETPQLITEPAPEAHIESISVHDRYLHTSPELCMKRLLAEGFSRIFQIARCFRGAERGRLHLPEFSLLEWYRTGSDYHDLMNECEMLFHFLAHRLELGSALHYRNMDIVLDAPWERLSVQTAFERYTDISVDKAIEKNLFEQIMVDHIEPHLGVKTPTFLYDYPASLAALARLKPGAPSVAERFEIYVGGVELANGFSELNDAAEQRRRFEKELKQRRLLEKPFSPMPEKFLRDLFNMPEAAGIALGVDRLVMVFSGARTIDEVVAFIPEDV